MPDSEVRIRTAAMIGVAAAGWVRAESAAFGPMWQSGLTLAAAGLGVLLGLTYDHLAYKGKKSKGAKG